MGFLKKLRLGWKQASTKQKIEIVLDVICGAGSAMGAIAVGNKISEGKNFVERFCIHTVTCGLGLAAGEVASKSLMTSYGELAGDLIDKAKERRTARQILEEEEEDE